MPKWIHRSDAIQQHQTVASQVKNRRGKRIGKYDGKKNDLPERITLMTNHVNSVKDKSAESTHFIHLPIAVDGTQRVRCSQSPPRIELPLVRALRV